MGVRAGGRGLWLGAKGGGKRLIASYLENFVLISQLKVFLERGCQEVGYLEDIEGSRPKTWMIGSFPMSFLMFFYPKEDTLKILC